MAIDRKRGNGSIVKTIGQRMKVYRKAAKLKGYEMAALLNVSNGSYSELENSISKPSAGTFKSYCTETNINIHWLLTGKGKMIRQSPPPLTSGPLKVVF